MDHAKAHTKIYFIHEKIMTQVKHFLTHITHSTHVKIWPMQSSQPRNPRYHATHAI